MHSFTCVSVVVYVARKLRPCPSYSRRRDRINLVLWRSLDKGGGYQVQGPQHQGLVLCNSRFLFPPRKSDGDGSFGSQLSERGQHSNQF